MIAWYKERGREMKKRIAVELWYQSIDYPVSGATEITGWLAVRGRKRRKLGIYLSEQAGKLYFRKSSGKVVNKKDFKIPLYRLYGELLRVKKRFTLECNHNGLILNEKFFKDLDLDFDLDASSKIMDTQRKLFLNGY